ncbi:MAG: tetratricopeptide repeat protein [Pedosphaera sp.]|nr:tetratricopeptide repeat protein [Pedosphaera sp.]
MKIQSSKRSPIALAAVAVIALAVAGLVQLWFHLHPAPAIPAPPDLNKLEPQLREYLAEKIVWVRSRPRRADRHALLGLVYSVNGLWHEARLAFQNSVSLDDREPLALMYAAIATQELGERDEALRLFHELVTKFPAFPQGYYRLGSLSLTAGKVDEAESAFRKLIELVPTEWRGYAGAGEALLRKGRYAEASKLLEKAIQLDSSARTTHHLLGQAYQALGKTADAEMELLLGRNAVTYPMPDPWSDSAPQHMKSLPDLLQMAEGHINGGEPLKAVEILAKAFFHHPNNVGLMNQLAIALNQSDQPNKAIVVLRQALNLDSNNVPALVTLAFSHHEAGQNKEALATAERAIALAPAIPQPYLAKANALLGMDQDELALKSLEAASKADPKNAEVFAQMGDIEWRNLNRPEDARKRYENALKLDASCIPALVHFADMLLQAGDVKTAEPLVARLRRLEPDSPDLPMLDERVRKLKK